MPATGVAPSSNVKDAAEIVAGSISSLKVAVTEVSRSTAVASSSGEVRITVGGVVSADVPVVKLQT